MTEVSRVMAVTPEKVFAILADGWSYSGWVVGSTHVRKVDDEWPAEGSRIHHDAGAWPVQVPDVSTVVAVSPGHMIELETQIWMAGRFRMRLTLTPLADGSTRVRMEERAVGGPVGVIPAAAQRWFLRPHNTEALSRLSDLAMGRAARERADCVGRAGESG